MPISRQEFDDGRLDLGIPVVQYLSIRTEEAFTADEVLYALLEIYERRATIGEVVITLEDLVAAEVMEAKVIAGMSLYTIARWVS